MYCGDEINNDNKTKKPFVISVISLIMFFIILLMTVFSMLEFYKGDSGAEGWIIIILIILTFIPLIVSFILSIIALILVSKYKKEGVEIPGKLNLLKTINMFQIPIIILIYVLFFMFKGDKYDDLITQKLNELYNMDYEIMDRCSVSNEGGDNYEIVIVKLPNFDYPIISNFDWHHDDYEDNYDELKRANTLNYQTYINSIFEEEVVSLMDFVNRESYNRINLKILLPQNYLENQNILKSKLKLIANNYVLRFPNYDFNFNIYFVEKIDTTLMYDYYIYMSSNNAGNCSSKLKQKIAPFIIKSFNILINEDRNVNTEIDNSFEEND